MPRTFAYLRVSNVSQTTDNQLQEIKMAGSNLRPALIGATPRTTICGPSWAN